MERDEAAVRSRPGHACDARPRRGVVFLAVAVVVLAGSGIGIWVGVGVGSTGAGTGTADSTGGTGTAGTTGTPRIVERVTTGNISASSSSELCNSLEGTTELRGSLRIEGKNVV